MLGEIWDTITEFISEVADQFSGFFTEVNIQGWLILSIIAEVCLWGFWYYAVYVKDIGNFLDWKTMVIGTVVAPVIAYILAWRASRE